MAYGSKEFFDEYGQYANYYPDIPNEIEETVKLFIQNDPKNIPFPKDASTKSEIRAVESLIQRCNTLCKENDDMLACNPYGECQMRFDRADTDDLIYAAKEYRNILRRWQNYNTEIDGVLRCSSKKHRCEYTRSIGFYGGSFDELIKVQDAEKKQQDIVDKIRGIK